MLFANNHDAMVAPSGLPSITSFHAGGGGAMSPSGVAPGYDHSSPLVAGVGLDMPSTSQQTGAALGKALASVRITFLSVGGLGFSVQGCIANFLIC